jgi:hypothetical protein
VKLESVYHPNPAPSGGPDFSALEGQGRWVGPPVQFPEGVNPEPTFWAAQLQCEEHYQDWGGVDLLHVYGAEVVPDSVYEVGVVSPGCNPQGGQVLTIATTTRGDIVSPFGSPNFDDIAASVAKFKEAPTAVIKVRGMLQPGILDLNQRISFRDISDTIAGFKSIPYPYGVPASCP